MILACCHRLVATFLTLTKKSQRAVFKLTALLTILSFILPYLGFAFTPANYPATSIAAQRLTSIQANGKTITIPMEYGEISSSFQGYQPRTVICLQDLHCHYEVQQHLAALIRHLVKNNQLQLIAVEGESQAINVGQLSTIPVKEVRQQVGDYFLRRGLITGAEFETALSDQPLTLYGIEEKKLYDQSKELLNQFLNAETQGYLEDLRLGLNDLKPSVYNQALARIDHQHLAYMTNKIDFTTYSRFLIEQAQQARLDLVPYHRLMSWYDRRPGHRDGQYIADPVREQAEQLEQALRDVHYSTDLQRQLDQQLAVLVVMESMVNISATPKQLNQFFKERADYQATEILKFITETARSVNTASYVFDDVLKLDHTIGLVEQFYHLVDKRSDAFVTNLVTLMDEQQQELALLVTGGFHTPLVEDLLKERGYSVITVKPRLTKTELTNPYFSLLRDRRTPLERLLAKKEGFFSLWSRFGSQLFQDHVRFIKEAIYQLEVNLASRQIGARDQAALQSLLASDPAAGARQPYFHSEPFYTADDGSVVAVQFTIDNRHYVAVLAGHDQQQQRDASKIVLHDQLTPEVGMSVYLPEQLGLTVIDEQVTVSNQELFNQTMAQAGHSNRWAAWQQRFNRWQQWLADATTQAWQRPIATTLTIAGLTVLLAVVVLPGPGVELGAGLVQSIGVNNSAPELELLTAITKLSDKVPGLEWLVASAIGWAGITKSGSMDKPRSKSEQALITAVKNHLGLLSTFGNKAAKIVDGFFQDWSKDQVNDFIQQLGYQLPTTMLPAEAFISLGIDLAKSKAGQWDTSGELSKAAQAAQNKMAQTSQPTSNALQAAAEYELNGQQVQVAGIYLVSLQATESTTVAQKLQASQIKSFAHYDQTSQTITIYQFPGQKNIQSGFKWFVKLANPRWRLSDAVESKLDQAFLDGLSEQTQQTIIEQMLGNLKDRYLTALVGSPREQALIAEEAKALFLHLNDFMPQLVVAELHRFLTATIAGNQPAQQFIWGLLPELDRYSIGGPLIADISRSVLTSPGDLTTLQYDLMALLEKYLTVQVKKDGLRHPAWVPLITLLQEHVARYVLGEENFAIMPLVVRVAKLDREHLLANLLLPHIESEKGVNPSFQANMLVTLSRAWGQVNDQAVAKRMLKQASRLYGVLAARQAPNREAIQAKDNHIENLLEVMASQSSLALFNLSEEVRGNWVGFIREYTNWPILLQRMDKLKTTLDMLRQFSSVEELRSNLSSQSGTSQLVWDMVSPLLSSANGEYARLINMLEDQLHDASERLNRRLTILKNSQSVLTHAGNVAKSLIGRSLGLVLDYSQTAFASNIINTAAELIHIPGMESIFIKAWVGQDIEDATKKNQIQQAVGLLFYQGAQVDDIRAYLRGEVPGYNENIALLILKKQAALDRIDLMERLITDQSQPALPERRIPFFELRLMAMKEVMIKERLRVELRPQNKDESINRVNQLRQALNGDGDQSLVELYIKHLLKSNPGRVGQVYSGEEPLADIKAQNFVMASWLDILNYSDQQKEKVISDEIMLANMERIRTAKAEPFSSTFNSAYRMGGQLLRQVDNSAEVLFTALAHEHGHNILHEEGIDQTWHFMTGLLHEWLADRLMRVFGRRYGLNEDVINQVLSFEQAANSIGEQAYIADEIHDGARAQEIYFRQALSSLAELAAGDRYQAMFDKLLKPSQSTLAQQLVDRSNYFWQLDHDKMLQTSLIVLKQPLTWNQSLPEVFTHIFAAYLDIPLSRLPYAVDLPQVVQATPKQVLGQEAITKIIYNLLRYRAWEASPAAVLLNHWLAGQLVRPSTRLDRMKAFLGEPIIATPIWETVLFMPVITGLFLGTAWPAMLGVIGMNAFLFGLVHRGRSPGGKVGLMGWGALFGMTLSAPAFILGAFTPLAAVVGLGIYVALHSSINYYLLKPYLIDLDHPVVRWLKTIQTQVSTLFNQARPILQSRSVMIAMVIVAIGLVTTVLPGETFLENTLLTEKNTKDDYFINYGLVNDLGILLMIIIGMVGNEKGDGENKKMKKKKERKPRGDPEYYNLN